MKLPSFLKLILCVAVCESAGLIGAFATMSNIDGWYQTLLAPALRPPNWVFGPVWTILYALMGVALFLIWQKELKNKARRVAVGVFAVQLVLNGAWTFLFFGAHLLGLALVEIILMWVMILLTLILFYRQSRVAGALLIPYLVWVSFATYLNYAFWALN